MDRHTELANWTELRPWLEAHDGGNAVIALFDIDEMFVVNWRKGHAAGDATLKRFASILSERAGGETKQPISAADQALQEAKRDGPGGLSVLRSA